MQDTSENTRSVYWQVPISLSSMNEIINNWRLYRERRYAIYRVTDGHYCNHTTCINLYPMVNFYGCTKCGNYHFCNRKILTKAKLAQIHTEVSMIEGREMDDIDQYIGSMYGIWCIPQFIRDNGNVICAISGCTIAERNTENTPNTLVDTGEVDEEGLLMSETTVSRYINDHPDFFNRKSRKLTKTNLTMSSTSKFISSEAHEWVSNSEMNDGYDSVNEYDSKKRKKDVDEKGATLRKSELRPVR